MAAFAGCHACGHTHQFEACAALRLPFIAQVWSQPSARLRLYFTDLAKRPQYSHVMFAEIDVDHMTVRSAACRPRHGSLGCAISGPLTPCICSLNYRTWLTAWVWRPVLL